MEVIFTIWIKDNGTQKPKRLTRLSVQAPTTIISIKTLTFEQYLILTTVLKKTEAHSEITLNGQAYLQSPPRANSPRKMIIFKVTDLCVIRSLWKHLNSQIDSEELQKWNKIHGIFLQTPEFRQHFDFIPRRAHVYCLFDRFRSFMHH